LWIGFFTITEVSSSSSSSFFSLFFCSFSWIFLIKIRLVR
jgi:hypothetical protein